jgi:hypothetical protein
MKAPLAVTTLRRIKMATPKPAAPSKPLSFRPPEMPKAVKKPKQRGQRVDIAIVDEKFNDNGGVTLTLGEVITELIGTPSEPKTVKTEKPKKPFVLDPRMTQRPFQDDRLMQLKNRLQRPSFKNS